MATRSFDENLELDTPEKIQRLLDAFDAADKRGRYKPKYDAIKLIEEGRERLGEVFR